MVGMQVLFLSFIMIMSCVDGASESTSSDPRMLHLTWSFNEEHEQSNFLTLPDPFLIERFSFSTDVFFEREELLRLLGFDEGAVVRHHQVRSGIQRLGYTKKFDHVSFTCTEAGQGWEVHMVLTARWTVGKVRCHGALLGKERYRHNYLLEAGDSFDAVQHHASCSSIEEALKEQGYIRPEVIDLLTYNDAYKTVDVSLVLVPGDQYQMRSFDIEFEECNALEMYRMLALKMKQAAIKNLYGHTYSRESVSQFEIELEQLCIHAGLLQTTITHRYDVNESKKSVDLTFHVTIGSQRRFNFFGNHFFSERQLLDRLLLFGKSVVLIPPALLAQELTEIYRSKGFLKSSVTWQEEEGRCLFCITEGPRALIKDIVFEGAHYFSYEQLRALCAGISKSIFFDKSQQRTWCDEITQAYVKAGFWNCTVGRCEPISMGDDEYMYHFNIHEGDRRFLGSVEVPDFEDIFVQSSVFDEYRAIVTPIPFNMYAVQEQRRALLAYLQKQGYLYASPTPHVWSDEQGIFHIRWHANPGQKILFGTTIFAGSTRLPFEYVRRELMYEKGQKWDQKKVERTVARLKSLGIFESVSVRPVDQKQTGVIPVTNSNSDDPELVIPDMYKDVVITCNDDDPFELRLRLGMQCIGQNWHFQDLGARGGGSCIWKNPLNRADRLEVAADVSPHWKYGHASYTVPWCRGLPLFTTVSLYGSRYDESLQSCPLQRVYRLAQDGCSLEWEYSDEYWQTGCVVGFETMKLYDLSRERALLIDFTPRLLNQHVPYTYIEPVAVFTLVDNLANPTYGFISTLTAKAMVSFKSDASSFFKILFDQSWYMPVLRDSVLALHARAGHIFYADFSSIMPSERFYLGGAYSLRGYDTDAAPPVRRCSERLGATCLVPVGGKTVLGLMTEVRFPLYKALGGVIFTDCGSLMRCAWKDNMFVGASGFGLRYATPVGPIRFDIAWKWYRQLGEEHRFTWFLTFGQAF